MGSNSKITILPAHSIVGAGTAYFENKVLTNKELKQKIKASKTNVFRENKKMKGVPVAVWMSTLAGVTLVSLISLIGIFTLLIKMERLKRIVLYLVSFAVGGLFGDALIHLIPESFHQLGSGPRTSLFIVLGILLFFVLEKILRWQHCHIPASEDHIHPVAALNLTGDAVHNFMDGVIIAVGFSTSVSIGIATTLAVIFHEIPQEIGDLGILMHKGLSIPKALSLNFVSSLMSFAGAILALSIGPHVAEFTAYCLPITAGGFLYIAGSDLIPELHHGEDARLSTSLKELGFIMLGVGIMAVLAFVE
jgi:zinc and cadmium transporter